MSAETLQAIATDTKKVQVALKTFFRITNEWEMTTAEKMALLDVTSRTTLNKWEKGEATKISNDQMTRISLVLGIYKALRILLPTVKQAHEWMNRPNAHYHGKTARQVLANGSIVSLFDMRRYLDGVRG